jgi:hypothetical protein
MNSKLLKSLYIYYFLIIFKTKYSFHHPLEIFIQDKTKTLKLLKHPVYSTVYENKICKLGHLVGILLILWICGRNTFLPKNKLLFYNKIIWFLVMSLGFIMNINFFTYLLPISIIDILYIK